MWSVYSSEYTQLKCIDYSAPLSMFLILSYRVCCPLSVSSVLQAHPTERSLCARPFPPCRHLQGLSFHVWLLFSLSTKLTTRNVKLCQVRRPRGSYDSNLTLWQRGVEQAMRKTKQKNTPQQNRKTRRNGLIKADGCTEICVHVFLSVTACVCVCAPQEDGLLGDRGALRMDSSEARGGAVHH